MSQKTIPYSLEAEQSLLGNILVFKNTIRECIEADVTSDDFYLDKHRRIYNICSSMFENRETIDTISLGNKLRDYNYLDTIGGLDYLLSLTDSTIDRTNTKEYIRIIKNKSLARRIIKAGEEIASDGYDGQASIDTVLENAEKKILDITRSRTDSEFKPSSEVFEAAVKKIEAIEKAGSTITGVKTRFSQLDSMTAGLQKSDMIILAARPSMGKSALALNIALNSAMVSSGACAIFSLEMPCEQLANRMLSAKAKVDGQKIRKGQLNEAEWIKIKEAEQELKRQKIFFDDTPGIKISDMNAKCRKLKEDYVYI